MSRTQKPGTNAKTAPPPPARNVNLGWKDKLHPDDYDQLKNTFELFDEDHSGFIDPEQISKIMDELAETRKGTFIFNLIEGLKEKSKPINFDQFLQLVAPKVGDLKTKEGIRTIFIHLDKNQDGQLSFQDLKGLSRLIGENINDDDILELLHTIHINKQTVTNQGINFEEFFQIVSEFYKKTA